MELNSALKKIGFTNLEIDKFKLNEDNIPKIGIETLVEFSEDIDGREDEMTDFIKSEILSSVTRMMMCQPIFEIISDKLISILAISKQCDIQERKNVEYRSETPTILSYGSLLSISTEFSEKIPEVLEVINESLINFRYENKEIRPADDEIINICERLIPRIEDVKVTESIEPEKQILLEYIRIFPKMVRNLTSTSIEMIAKQFAEIVLKDRLPVLVRDVMERFMNKSSTSPNESAGLREVYNILKDNRYSTEVKKQLLQETMIGCHQKHPEKCEACKASELCESIRNGDIPDFPILN